MHDHLRDDAHIAHVSSGQQRQQSGRKQRQLACQLWNQKRLGIALQHSKTLKPFRKFFHTGGFVGILELYIRLIKTMLVLQSVEDTFMIVITAAVLLQIPFPSGGSRGRARGTAASSNAAHSCSRWVEVVLGLLKQ